MNDLIPDPLPATIDPQRAHRLIGAIRSCWSEALAIEPERWSTERPATGHCDVSSIAWWDEFGGEMVLSAVFVGEEQTEFHWSNRIDGIDVDLTRSQFFGHEDIRVVEVYGPDEIERRRRGFRAEVIGRSDRFNELVAEQLI